VFLDRLCTAPSLSLDRRLSFEIIMRPHRTKLRSRNGLVVVSANILLPCCLVRFFVEYSTIECTIRFGGKQQKRRQSQISRRCMFWDNKQAVRFRTLFKRRYSQTGVIWWPATLSGTLRRSLGSGLSTTTTTTAGGVLFCLCVCRKVLALLQSVKLLPLGRAIIACVSGTNYTA
jgi:hypothetical protein